jgi:CubicO group peptidase (beta-lactamase class C family)
MASFAADIDAIFSQWNAPDSPGCAVLITVDGDPLYRRGHGLASLEHGAPITSATVFNVGSISKQFTAMAILLLEDEGKLTLDDDVRRYVPELPDFGTPMTIGHLLTHTRACESSRICSRSRAGATATAMSSPNATSSTW